MGCLLQEDWGNRVSRALQEPSVQFAIRNGPKTRLELLPTIGYACIMHRFRPDLPGRRNSIRQPPPKLNVEQRNPQI